ncbi:sulfatase [Lentisphaerota bacterium WC36G]|nr:sulfatase [Lentisphaerae bacterium WC36]
MLFKKVLISTTLLSCNALSASDDFIKPNFVLIIADDISADDLGCYGNKNIKTPNIDALAESGVKFNSAFLTAASCSPSRSSIITGRFPTATGQVDLATGALPSINEPFPKFFDNLTFFPQLLKDNGYFTAHNGKWHIGYSSHKPSGPAKNAFDFTQSSKDTSGAKNWVKTLQRRPKEKPFFMWFASHDAHRGWSGKKVTNPKDVTVPPFLPDTEFVRKDLAQYYDEIVRFDYYVGEVVKELKKENVFDNTLIIVMADNGRPFWRSKAQIYDSGMKTPFVVSYPNLLKRSKFVGHKSNALISTIDISATILDAAKIEYKNCSIEGRSFLPVLNGDEKQVNKYVFSERNWHGYASNQRAVRDERFLYVKNFHPELSRLGTKDYVKYMFKLDKAGKLNEIQRRIFVAPSPVEELYDMKNDPHQLVDLAKNEKYAEKLIELRSVTNQWLKIVGHTVPRNYVPDWYVRPYEKTEVKKEWGETAGTFNFGIDNGAEIRKLTEIKK